MTGDSTVAVPHGGSRPRGAGVGILRRRGPAAPVAALLAGLLASGAHAESPVTHGPLTELARPGPWSGVSGLIGYGGRLWLVNSEKFVNHNSADIYSYDPHAGALRFERHLFSQDAGDPTVVDGVLVWPFEDSRWSTGRGEYALTNGRDWAWHSLPEGRAFHLHAMTSSGGALFASFSAWRAGLQRSDDLGRTWRLLYDHPTATRRVSRFVSLAAANGAVFAGLSSASQPGAKLFVLERGRVRALAGWPDGERTTYLARAGREIYAVNHADSGTTLWRTDGARVEEIAQLRGTAVRALAADGQGGLWAVSNSDEGTTLWRSADGVAWRTVQRLAGVEPLAVHVYRGRVYVGTRDPAGRGALWGPAAPAARAPAPARVALPTQGRDLSRREVTALLGELDAALAGGDGLRGHRTRLLAVLRPLALSDAPEVADALSERLARRYGDAPMSAFGGAVEVSLERANRWYLLWALAAHGRGRIPVSLLESPWTQSPNRAEKYFETAPAAATAVARLGQSDPATIAALIARLGSDRQPEWLIGDLVGALTALTGQRFGYDLRAWRAWWRQRLDGRD